MYTDLTKNAVMEVDFIHRNFVSPCYSAVSVANGRHSAAVKAYPSLRQH
jgi:hypothetical protein